jgi:Uma2 family endonuclease
MYGAGSTTFKRGDIGQSFEPDSCFYTRNRERVRGKVRIDLDVDPPPDLVVEIDITSPSLGKLPIYARIGVPEVWRYDEGRVEILALRGEGYAEVTESTILPPLTREDLQFLIDQSTSLEIGEWLDKVAERARRSA